MMYVLALASAAIADIMDQAKELDRQDMLGRVTVLRTKAQGDRVLWSLRRIRFPHSLLPVRIFGQAQCSQKIVSP